jgi:hypothetical protein
VLDDCAFLLFAALAIGSKSMIPSMLRQQAMKPFQRSAAAAEKQGSARV